MEKMAPMPPEVRKAQNVRLLVIGGVAALVIALALSGHREIALPLSVAAWLVFLSGTLRPGSGLFGPVKRRGDGEVVTLTIDDGPDPETTPALLELLKRHGEVATFFLIGERAARYPELVRMIVEQGHHLGNHTQTHPQASFWCLGPTRLWREIWGCQETLRGITNASPTLFRSPVGHTNPFIQPILTALGLQRVAWTARGYDAVRTDVARIVNDISADLRPGAIVLLHDATKIAAPVLEKLLEVMKARGLRT